MSGTVVRPEAIVIGQLVEDRDGDLWRRGVDGRWHCATQPSVRPRDWWALNEKYGPLWGPPERTVPVSTARGN